MAAGVDKPDTVEVHFSNGEVATITKTIFAKRFKIVGEDTYASDPQQLVERLLVRFNT